MSEENGIVLKCGDCGKEDLTVTEGECPFAAEIHDTVELVTLCEGCYHERAMDI